MNFHKQVIDLMPEVMNYNSDDFKKIFFDIASNNPKAILDSHERMNAPKDTENIAWIRDYFMLNHSIEINRNDSTNQALNDVVEYMAAGKRISAIKLIRQITNEGLRNSKFSMDHYQVKFNLVDSF